jgi:hypothetical protein
VQPAPTVASEPTPTPTSPAIAGAETKPAPVLPAEKDEPELVVLAEDDKFIAVEEKTTTTAELSTDTGTSTAPTSTPQYANWAERLLASPKKTLEYSYIALSGLILIVILLMINKEIERHHLKHIFYGLALLVLMYLLLSASKAILVSEVIVK